MLLVAGHDPWVAGESMLPRQPEIGIPVLAHAQGVIETPDGEKLTPIEHRRSDHGDPIAPEEIAAVVHGSEASFGSAHADLFETAVHEGRAGMIGETLQSCEDRAGKQTVVRVEENNLVRRRVSQAKVTSGRQPSVVLPNDANTGEWRENFRQILGSAIVDDEDLGRRWQLLARAPYGSLEKSPLLEARDYDCDRGSWHRIQSS